MARKAEKKTVATVEMNASCDKKNAVFFTCSEHSKELYKYSVEEREDGFPEEGSCKGEAVMIEGVEYCREYRLFEIKA